MAAVLAGGTQAVGSGQVPSTSSAVATQQQQQGVPQPPTSVENYQFLLPRIFEPSLTEEEIQQRENERAER